MNKHHESHVELTPEQIAAAAAAAAIAAKAAAKNEKAAAATKKAEAEAVKAAKAAERASKVGNKETKKAETEAAKAAKIKAKEDAKAAKEASRQPEQNGVRRPRAEGVCGRVWGLCDDISTKLMTPAPVANVIEAGTAEKIDMSTLRTQYARWKKFHGISGSIKAVTAQV